jgi:hypothetical protein
MRVRFCKENERDLTLTLTIDIFTFDIFRPRIKARAYGVMR